MTDPAFDWPIDRSDLPKLPDVTDPPTPEYITAVIERNAAENLAVAVLYALSGRQFGLQTQVARPCPAYGYSRYLGAPLIGDYVVLWDQDRWLTWPCGCLGGRCTVGGPRAVHLPGPVYDVTEVNIEGDVLDPLGYQLEGNVLYRTGSTPTDFPPSPRWPRQDLHRPLGEVHTWSVTYLQGIPAPSGVAQLTGLLAAEILAALTQDGKCRLPRTVTTVSRNGVSYRAYDPAVIYANGKTGIPEIDLWLAAINPNHLASSPTVI